MIPMSDSPLVHGATPGGSESCKNGSKCLSVSLRNRLPRECLTRMAYSCSQQDAHLIPSLCSLLSTPPSTILFSYWLDSQMLGTFHTVELASHLVRLYPENPPSIAYACELYQTYCTSESPFPVACEVRPETLEALFHILEDSQDKDPATLLDGYLFTQLFDELCYFLLPHFMFYIYSSEFTYSTFDRILLADANAGYAELMFEVCKQNYQEEIPLFVMDLHAFLRKFFDETPPKLLAAIKTLEKKRKNKPLAGAAGGMSNSVAAAAASISMAAALEDGYDFDGNNDSSWVLSVKHQKWLEEGLIPRNTAVLHPRPSIPACYASTTSAISPPTPSSTGSNQHPPSPPNGTGVNQMVHIGRFVEERLRDIQILYENYLQPSSQAHKHMLHSALVSLAQPKFNTAGRGNGRGGGGNSQGAGHLQQGGLKSGTQMSQQHPLSRRAEFAIKDLPYYLLRNFLDVFHMASKYGFINHELFDALYAIKLWCIRDIQLRKGILKTYYEEMHFGLGLKMGLAHGKIRDRSLPPPNNAANGIGKGGSNAGVKKPTSLRGPQSRYSSSPRSRRLVHPVVNQSWFDLGDFEFEPPKCCCVPPTVPHESVQAALKAKFKSPSSSRANGGLKRAYSEGELPALEEHWNLLQNTGVALPTFSASDSIISPLATSSSVVATLSPPPPAAAAQSLRSANSQVYRQARSRGGSLGHFIPGHTRGVSAMLAANNSILSAATRDTSALKAIARSSLIAAHSSALSPLHAPNTSAAPPASNASATLLPALPFQPPERSFHFGTVNLYRKHVLGMSRRAQKEEEDALANNSVPSATGAASASSTSTGMMKIPSSSIDRLRRQSGQGTPAPGTNSASSSPDKVNANSGRRNNNSNKGSGSSKKVRIGLSADELDLQRVARLSLVHASVHPPSDLSVITSGRSTPDAGVMLTPAKTQILHEQMQSMRHIFSSSPPQKSSVSPPPLSNSQGSFGLQAPLTPSSGRKDETNATSPASSHLLSPPDPRMKSFTLSHAHTPRSVRFPTHLRHEVREFDADGEVPSPCLQKSPTKNSKSILKPNKLSFTVDDHSSAHPHQNGTFRNALGSVSFPAGLVSPSAAAYATTSSSSSSASNSPAPPNSTSLTTHRPSLCYSDLMRKIYDDRQTETSRLLQILMKGNVFLKFQSSSAGNVLTSTAATSFAKSEHRFFYINSEASELRWCKLVNTTKNSDQTVTVGGQKKKPQKESVFYKHKFRLLADGLRLFPDSFHSPHFTLYNNSNSPPWLCLTLLLVDRSLDLVALNEQQAMDWFFGLQALIPLNPSFKSVGLYRWHKLRLKIQYYAKQRNQHIATFCRILMNNVRLAIQEGRSPSEGLPPSAMGGLQHANNSVLGSTPTDADKQARKDERKRLKKAAKEAEKALKKANRKAAKAAAAAAKVNAEGVSEAAAASSSSSFSAHESNGKHEDEFSSDSSTSRSDEKTDDESLRISIDVDEANATSKRDAHGSKLLSLREALMDENHNLEMPSPTAKVKRL